jgi:hypothetical protein
MAKCSGRLFVLVSRIIAADRSGVISSQPPKAFPQEVTKPGKFSDRAILYWSEIFCIGPKHFLDIHADHNLLL